MEQELQSLQEEASRFLGVGTRAAEQVGVSEGSRSAQDFADVAKWGDDTVLHFHPSQPSRPVSCLTNQISELRFPRQVIISIVIL